MHCIGNATTLPHGDGGCIRIWMPKPAEHYDHTIDELTHTLDPTTVLLVLPGMIPTDSDDWVDLLDSLFLFAPEWLHVHIWTRPGSYTYRRWQPCGCNDCINFRCNLH